MASEATTANPELLQEQVAQVLVQPLEAASVVLSSGRADLRHRQLATHPQLTAGATVGFVGEGELIPEADVDFGEVTLMPSTRKSLKTLIRFTNELVGSFIRDGSPREVRRGRAGWPHLIPVQVGPLPYG